MSRGISLGPTDITTEGTTSMDGGDGGLWNTGGAISVKDKTPPVISELEGEQENGIKTQSWSDDETGEERNRGNDTKDENSGNLSFTSDNQVDANGAEADEPHDEIIPTSTVVASEGTESTSTTSAINDYDYNEQGHSLHNTNKDGIVSTKEEKEEELISSRDQEQLPPPVAAGTETNRQTTISPTPSQITRHPKQDLLIETTTLLGEEVWTPVLGSSSATAAGSTSIPHVASAVPPMPTNRLQRLNILEGFDDTVDVANGEQLDTAGLKAKESVAQVPTEDRPHGATNENTTSHVDKSNSKETAATHTAGVHVRGGGVGENVAAEVSIPLDDGTTNKDDDDGGTDAVPDAGMIDASKCGDSDCNYSEGGIRVLNGVQTSTTTVTGEAGVEGKGEDPPSSEDKAISHGTDSPSSRPAASVGDIPTARTIPSSTGTKGIWTSETDVSDKVTAAAGVSACTTADCSATAQGDKEITALPESAVSGRSADDNRAENYNLDISQLSGGGAESDSYSNDDVPPSVENRDGVKLNILGSNSLNARLSMDSETVSLDKEPNKNSGLPSSTQHQQPGSKHQESNVDRLEGDGMTGMKSGGMEVMEGSRGDSGEYTLTKDSWSHSGGTGTGGDSSGSEMGDRHQDTQRNGMNGMQPGMPDNSDPQGDTLSPPPSHPSDSPDILNSYDVTLDSGSGRSRHPTSQVTDDLPKTTEGDSLDVSRASTINDRDHSSSSPPPVSAQASPRNASLTENSVNGSLSTQRSLTNTEPQGNGSLANQNARLGDGAEETPVGAQPTQSQHRHDDAVLEANNSSSAQSRNNSSNGSNNGTHGSTPPPPVQNLPQGAGLGGQGGTVKDREKSVFLRLSNQIQELETNMSLFSSYLDQISTRLAFYLKITNFLYMYMYAPCLIFSCVPL